MDPEIALTFPTNELIVDFNIHKWGRVMEEISGYFLSDLVSFKMTQLLFKMTPLLFKMTSYFLKWLPVTIHIEKVTIVTL